MTWLELCMLLESMKKSKHTSLCDTPQQRVTITMDDGEDYFVDLFESMTSGKLHFVIHAGEEDGA